MDNDSTQKRGKFSSSIGFILSSAGAAIGLGNLWKFPYVVGYNGGGLFIIFYIMFSIILGIPITLAEMSIGRTTQLSAAAAYKKLNNKWTFVGALGVLCSLILLFYYCVVGGWVLKYIFSYLTNQSFGTDKVKFFNNFISSTSEPIIFTLLFLIICTAIVLLGISKGIEKTSKIMLPGLFILLFVVAIKSVTLPNASQGLNFLFAVNLNSIGSTSDILKSLAAALSQSFFSLGLGMGITVTYGSYLSKNENMPKSSAWIAFLDIVISILSGLAILPAVFSFGFEPSSGPGLIFHTLPMVFESIPLGNIFGLIFFLLVFFAATTSAMASLEVISATLIDMLKIKRHSATIISAVVIGIMSTLVSLSNGLLENFKIMGMNLFDFLVYFTDKLFMPLSAIFTCIFVGYIYKSKNLLKEIRLGDENFKFSKFFDIIMKYVAPIFIFIVFIIGLTQK